MKPEKKIAIIGATGYTGQELLRLLVTHPGVKVSVLTSRENQGTPYDKLFPQFRGYSLPALSAYDIKSLKGKIDLIFYCLPHGESQQSVAEAYDNGIKAVDLSADYRLKNVTDYNRWYGAHSRPDLFKHAVYGIPELYRAQIKKARLVANPGCYPTGVILGVGPLLSAGAVSAEHVIADMKSGVSGAGRKAKTDYLFCEIDEDFRAYNLYGHRHTSEMEQELGLAAGKKVRVTFSPHLVPMSRGILGTIYLKLTRKSDTAALHAILAGAYKHEPFIRVLDPGELPRVGNVRSTNFVDLAILASPTGRDATLLSAIDNLTKGASGAAVQNMNIMLGLPETMGLLGAPMRP